MCWNSQSSAGACLGVSAQVVVTKSLGFPAFSSRFRIRLGEQVTPIGVQFLAVTSGFYGNISKVGS